MRIAVIDGQGGGIGKVIVERLRKELPKNVNIIALGTNSAATILMLKAGADEGATGENAVREIIREREKAGNYISFRDFCERISNKDISKKCVESLIKCGAFDSLGVYRSKLMVSYEKMIDSIQESRRKNLEGQLSIFDIVTNIEDINKDENIYPDIKEYPSNVLLAMEKEMLGLYVSGHPLEEFKIEISNNTTFNSMDLKLKTIEDDDGLKEAEDRILTDRTTVVIGGIITEKKIKATKNDNLMAFVTLEDLYGTIEIIVFPRELKSYQELLTEENIVIVKGRLSIREDEEPKVICSEVKSMNRIKTHNKMENKEYKEYKEQKEHIQNNEYKGNKENKSKIIFFMLLCYLLNRYSLHNNSICKTNILFVISYK
jgi:DNA polymerase-3 subunit alpha